MTNQAFRRALRCLSHPITIGSVMLLLLNDHVLRVLWPSWWTGKLGDFSWLVFFPFILAAILAWLIPSRIGHHEEIVAGLAFGLTGLVFTLMNTIPAAMETGLWLLSQITGGLFTLRLDPTDLLTLPALFLGWAIWQRSEKPAPASHGWVILALGALATVANMPPPCGGIDCLQISDSGTITAGFHEGGTTYVSKDGGLTWATSRRWERDSEETRGCSFGGDVYYDSLVPWEISDPADPDIVYRFVPEEMIQRSVDGGQTWTTDIDVRLSEAQREYYITIEDRSCFQPGPLDAVIHSPSGNIVIAMGYQGILTRTPDGEWHWIAFNAADERFPGYHYVDPQHINFVLSLLAYEKWLALVLIGLVIATLSLMVPVSRPARIFKIVCTCIVWGIWAYPTIRILAAWGAEAFLSTYVDIDPNLRFMQIAALLTLPFSATGSILFGILGLKNIDKHFSRIPTSAWVSSLAAPILYFMPYMLWSQGIIPRYWMAASLALILIAATVYRGWQSLRQVAPAETIHHDSNIDEQPNRHNP